MELNQNRPVEIKIYNTDIVSELFYSKKVYTSNNDLLDVLVFPTIQILTWKDISEKFEMKIDEKMFSKELGLKFNHFTYSIGKLVRLAELTNDNLRKFIEKYFLNVDLEDFYSKNSSCEKLRFLKIDSKEAHLTFGNLVNILRNIIKSDERFYNIKDLSTNKKRKKYRKIFIDFVEDRDYFTHGVLFFLYPKFDPIIRIRTNQRKDRYLSYSKDIFLYNLEAYNFLTKTLLEMQNEVDNFSR